MIDNQYKEYCTDAKNVHNLKWERFLFAEFAAQRNISEIVPPNCSRCDEFPICFPIAS